MKKAFAVHECGKAMVATVLRQQSGRMEQVERVSMVPRGRSALITLPWLALSDNRFLVLREVRFCLCCAQKGSVTTVSWCWNLLCTSVVLHAATIQAYTAGISYKYT